MKPPLNWPAVGATVGILGLITSAGFGYFQLQSDHKTSESYNITTSGNDSSVIIGNEGSVNVD